MGGAFGAQSNSAPPSRNPKPLTLINTALFQLLLIHNELNKEKLFFFEKKIKRWFKKKTPPFLMGGAL